MAVFLLFYYLLLASYSAKAAVERPVNISQGSYLTPAGNSSWLSPSGLYAFGFYQQGSGYRLGIFLPKVPEKTVVWTANRDSPIVPNNVTLVLSAYGRLVLQEAQGRQIWSFNVSESIFSASMLDFGNFVLYNSDEKIIWQSFDHPTDTLLSGQRLSAGQELFSSASRTDYSRGIFHLIMQTDGNLVQYPVDAPGGPQYAYWASNTYGTGKNVTLNLNDAGHLYLLLPDNDSIILNLTRGGYTKYRAIYIARIDVDGIFRLYSHSLERDNWSILWQSSSDKCDPKGICGPNAFCTQMDTQIECKCLPGFDFIIQGNWSLGCKRNFTTDGCNAKIGNSKLSIGSLENTIWEDDPYHVLVTNTTESCEQACLEDCNCEVAFFEEGECRKQKLPLRYGRRSISASNVVLVKVGIPTTLTPGIPGDVPKSSKKKQNDDILIISILLLVVSLLILAISGVLIISRKSNVSL